MKKMIFVSTGRCGTKRIAEILREKLPDDQYVVVHQMKFSRAANIVGNILFYTKEVDFIKHALYSFLTDRYTKHKNGANFISTDPLTAMIIPKKYITSSDVYIIHIVRDDESFAKSMFSLSRSRIKSLIAHNLIPLWQPGIWPFENLWNKNIVSKYKNVSSSKNKYFYDRYSSSPNYSQVKMRDLFTTNRLQEVINEWFNENISISARHLRRKANESIPHTAKKR
jgi:hypothetical protein